MKRGKELASKVASLPCLSGFLASIILTSPPLVSGEKQIIVSTFSPATSFSFFFFFSLRSPFGTDGEGDILTYSSEAFSVM